MDDKEFKCIQNLPTRIKELQEVCISDALNKEDEQSGNQRDELLPCLFSIHVDDFERNDGRSSQLR